ncbi:MAG: hypothetical protein JW741_12770 [Sedimentisphaerales bacterium]|nr:hypothetical protein [Sedimentisphaerales bacterium]
MAKKILNTLTFGLSGAIIGDGKKKKATPAPAAPRVMPIADDEAVLRARRASILRQRGRRGRSSTMLTTDSDKLGS